VQLVLELTNDARGGHSWPPLAPAPRPAPPEVTPMLNVHAITDQKIAVGLVENPCCFRLREYAAKVPADQAIVELGAFKGRTTGWLALGASEGNGAVVHSVDPWDEGEI